VVGHYPLAVNHAISFYPFDLGNQAQLDNEKGQIISKTAMKNTPSPVQCRQGFWTGLTAE
jgi:hypothetical protein